MLTITNPTADYFKTISLKDCLDGNAADTHFTAKVYAKLLDEIQDKGLEKLYEKLISPLTTVFRDIELEGIHVDTERLQEIKDELEISITQIKIELKDSPLIPPDLNLGSNNDLCKILFSVEKDKDADGDPVWNIVEDIGFGLYPFKYTGKDAPTTDAETIKKMHEMVEEEYVRRGLSGKA